jgi:hypothetical protein
VRKIEYPRLPEGSVPPAVKKALWDLVDQVNAVISEIENTTKGGSKNGSNG